jgi:hypothetical protein
MAVLNQTIVETVGCLHSANLLQQAMVLAYGTVRDLLVVAQVLVRLGLEPEVLLLEFW